MQTALPWLNYISYFAVEEIRRQYSRTRLGYSWLLLSQFINIAGIAAVFGLIFKQDLKQFFPYVSAGLVTWTFASNSINEMSRAYVSNSSIIQNFTFPLWVFVIQIALKNFIIFLHGIAIHFCIFILLGGKLSISILIFPIFGVFLFYILVLLGQISALLGARFRDFSIALNNALYLAFLISPIIWRSDVVPENYFWLIELNPFYHMIEIIRAPLLGNLPTTKSIFFMLVIFIMGLTLEYCLMRRYKRFVVYWV